MTSEDILYWPPNQRSDFWLRQIAYQLALANEKKAPTPWRGREDFEAGRARWQAKKGEEKE